MIDNDKYLVTASIGWLALVQVMVLVLKVAGIKIPLFYSISFLVV